jgi:tRNA pseudouridine55 synthase
VSGVPDDFVIPVDKPEGPTSHDVVARARRSLGTRRIGHTGTLDPFASGLLLLCVGKATRLAEYLSGLDKTYEAIAVLGTSTDTLDREGAVVEQRDGWTSLTGEDIEEALAAFRGTTDQVPPRYSAKKVAGEVAHRRARRGEDVELAPVRVTISSLEATSLALPRVGMRVTCSSGTYVRSLARDVGDALGVGAHLAELRRTSIGSFSVECALSLDELDDPARVTSAALDPLQALHHLPQMDVSEDVAARLAHGQAVRVLDVEREVVGPIAVTHAGGLIAVGESTGGVLRPRKVFVA